MDLSVGEVETDLVDLSHASLSTLRECDQTQLTHSVRRLMDQIDSDRANIGGSGPPGRVD